MYRAGLAGSQAAHEQAVSEVFECLDELEARLQNNTYLLGDEITETDWRVFVTLIRFDIAYHGLFKCNLKRLTDYEYLPRYLKRLYDVPGGCRHGEFRSHKKNLLQHSKTQPGWHRTARPQTSILERQCLVGC